MSKVTLLYNWAANYPYHFEAEGNAAFNGQQGSIVDGGYVIIGTGNESLVRACVSIIEEFRNGKCWDAKYVIHKYIPIYKELSAVRHNRKP